MPQTSFSLILCLFLNGQSFSISQYFVNTLYICYFVDMQMDQADSRQASRLSAEAHAKLERKGGGDSSEVLNALRLQSLGGQTERGSGGGGSGGAGSDELFLAP